MNSFICLSHDSYLYDFIYYTISFDIWIGGLIRTVSMDINVNDDHTVVCAIAHAADAHLSNSDDCSHNDYGSDGSGVDSCYSVGLKTDSVV